MHGIIHQCRRRARPARHACLGDVHRQHLVGNPRVPPLHSRTACCLTRLPFAPGRGAEEVAGGGGAPAVRGAAAGAFPHRPAAPGPQRRDAGGRATHAHMRAVRLAASSWPPAHTSAAPLLNSLTCRDSSPCPSLLPVAGCCSAGARGGGVRAGGAAWQLPCQASPAQRQTGVLRVGAVVWQFTPRVARQFASRVDASAQQPSIWRKEPLQQAAEVMLCTRQCLGHAPAGFPSPVAAATRSTAPASCSPLRAVQARRLRPPAIV